MLEENIQFESQQEFRPLISDSVNFWHLIGRDEPFDRLKLVELYSATNITHPENRLPAIAAVTK